MVVSFLCTSRSGSTNLSYYLSKVLNLELIVSPFMRGNHSIKELNKKGLYKVFIHNQTVEYNSLYLFGEAIINHSDVTILYDRVNKEHQAESLAYKKAIYKRDLGKYHNREYYDMEKVSKSFIDQCYNEFTEHSRAISQLSIRYNLPIFYYEDVYFGDGLQLLSEYLKVPLNAFLKDKHLNVQNRERKFNIDLI